ncbi:MAG TPA: NrsF family protein [Bryobacteraceae bacterium]
MTCRDVEPSMVPYAAGRPIPRAAAAHIAGCERCRNLAALLSRADSSTAPGPEQLQYIKSEIVADIQPVKPLAPPAVLFALLLAASIAAAGVGVSQLGIAGWRARDAIQRIAAFTILSLGSVLFASSLVREIAPGSRVFVPASRSIAGVLAIFTGIFAALFQVHPERAFVATGLVCLRIGLECAFAVAAISWLILRRGAALNRTAAGALAGALAGISGLALLETFCPNLNRYHVLVWHLGAAVGSTIAGILAGIVAQRIDTQR